MKTGYPLGNERPKHTNHVSSLNNIKIESVSYNRENWDMDHISDDQRLDRRQMIPEDKCDLWDLSSLSSLSIERHSQMSKNATGSAQNYFAIRREARNEARRARRSQPDVREAKNEAERIRRSQPGVRESYNETRRARRLEAKNNGQNGPRAAKRKTAQHNVAERQTAENEATEKKATCFSADLPL